MSSMCDVTKQSNYARHEDLLVLLSLEEHVIVTGDHQTDVGQEAITSTVHKLQYILEQPTAHDLHVWPIAWELNYHQLQSHLTKISEASFTIGSFCGAVTVAADSRPDDVIAADDDTVCSCCWVQSSIWVFSSVRSSSILCRALTHTHCEVLCVNMLPTYVCATQSPD